MADTVVTLGWAGAGLVFRGGSPGGHEVDVDGDGAAAASPMQLFLVSIAGCTGADVIDILGRMRVAVDALEVRIEGDRRPEPPRRFTRLRLHYTARGLAESDEPKLRRAVELSHEKYCSALHTLAPDVALETEVRLE